MRSRGAGVGLTVTLLIFILCCANSRIEKRIGFFDLHGAPIMESTVIALLGEGRTEVERSGDKVLSKRHVFYAPEAGAWVEIGFSHVLTEKKERCLETILVTAEKLCDEMYIPKKPFGELGTGRGIILGDSPGRVLETYGRPTIIIELGRDNVFSVLAERLKLKEGRVWRYLPDDPKESCFAEFHFKKEKLRSLLVSASE